MSAEFNSSTDENGYKSKEALSVPLASQIFVKSFELSSCNTTLQDDLFVGINKINPTWSIEDSMKYEIFKESLPAVRDLFMQEITVGDKESDASIKTLAQIQLSSMQHRFTGIKEAKGIGDPLQIAQLMLLEDLKSYFILRDNPKTENDKTHYISKFCNYVLEQQPTGLDVFDKLFSSVKRDFEAVDLSEGPHIRVYRYLRLIGDVVKAHTESNPEKEEFYKEKGFI